MKGNLDAGLRDHNKAIRLDPDDADHYFNRGRTREEKGDLEGALRDYTEAIGFVQTMP
ncbi:tetratricopeptide repeat protein [Nitrosospira briensis]|uniref:tetratricopeptide repeat protein n=1 Tax=Nitrosospira briensis TaxID=35799 RepID=UPI0008E7EEEE|nr:tetratricopeptide repeat protein [Nitrosospira briensis]SFN67398.1 Tetratricopeptide repeat-containing protein [Nitrosospira briensis]